MLLLQSAGLLLQGFTPSLGAWFAARAAQGVGSGLVLTANMATGTDAFEEVKDSNYVEPMILVYSMYIGAVCGAPFGGVGFTIQPFLPFLFLGLAELLLLAAVHSKLDAPSIAMPGTQPLLSLLQYPMISRPVALICLLVMYTAALQAMLFRVLEEDLELTVGAASFTWLFQAWPAILGVLCLGPAAQRIGFRLIMLTGILLAGTSALLADESLTVLILELVAVGLALGAENATVPRLLEDVGIRHFEAPVSNNNHNTLKLGPATGLCHGPLDRCLAMSCEQLPNNVQILWGSTPRICLGAHCRLRGIHAETVEPLRFTDQYGFGAKPATSGTLRAFMFFFYILFGFLFPGSSAN